MAYFALAFLSVPVFFIWTQDLTLLLLAGAFSGIFVSGQFTWMSAWLPELFPTRVRATATAFVFNAPRLISWTGPLISGWLIANFGGFSQAAVVIATVYILGLVAAFLPERGGKRWREESTPGSGRAPPRAGAFILPRREASNANKPG